MTSNPRHAPSNKVPESPWVRLFIIIVALVVVGFGGVVLKMINLADQTHQLAISNKSLIQQLKDVQDENHKLALARDAAIRQQVNYLACLFISQTPNDPKKPQIAQFRSIFGCPPFDPNAKNKPLPTPPTVGANPTPSTSPSSLFTPEPRRTVNQVGPGGAQPTSLLPSSPSRGGIPVPPVPTTFSPRPRPSPTPTPTLPIIHPIPSPPPPMCLPRPVGCIRHPHFLVAVQLQLLLAIKDQI